MHSQITRLRAAMATVRGTLLGGTVSLALVLASCKPASGPGGPAAPACPAGRICFLQPFGSMVSIDPADTSHPLGVLEVYFNALFPWLAGVCAGIALLMVLVGGVEIIRSGGDSTARQNGIERMKWAIAGLFIIIFANVILRTLNPNFYR